MSACLFLFAFLADSNPLHIALDRSVLVCPVAIPVAIFDSAMERHDLDLYGLQDALGLVGCMRRILANAIATSKLPSDFDYSATKVEQ